MERRPDPKEDTRSLAPPRSQETIERSTARRGMDEPGMACSAPRGVSGGTQTAPDRVGARWSSSDM
ncbi:hypothetical protein IG193_08565 [Infirmifilum lucidum]|uniref:Uncharacterized protein n=1 Tax=Infirmifilum lucidum TaxID=2776706 RepID=A0A7L9FJ16_9CREN|nr:hypothetical protein [Infirmifilum lucidum]QOJ78785.1 hypothetical protein IG193_08565 [Infirmifilum lucidum]